MSPPSPDPERESAASHTRRLDTHAARLAELELWRASHSAHASSAEIEMRGNVTDLHSAVTALLREVHANALESKVSAARIAIYAGIGSSVALAVLGSVLAVVFKASGK